MESITHFLDPKTIPDVTGDKVDVDKALAAKSDLDADSDTIEINITNNVDKAKTTSTTAKAEKPKLSDVVLPGKKESDDQEEDSASEETAEPEDAAEEEPAQEETAEEPKEEAPVETGDAENESEETEGEPVETADDSTEEPKEDASEEPKEEEPAEEKPEQTEENPEVDHGENDLEVDQQQPEPLLKLVSEYSYYSTKIYEIPNGAKIIYINKPSELCFCSFDFKVGSYYEDDSNRGISHLLEHLMFNGCPGISSLEFNAKLDKLGMSVNAFTDRMLTSFHFDGLKANFIPAFDLYFNLISSFTPTQPIVDKEKGVVINEIGVYNDNNWVVLREAIHSQAYRQHPVAYPVLGFEDVVRNISVEQVKEWYETNYNAKNLTVYLVGDFPEEDLVFVAGKLQLFRDGEKNADPVITDAMALPFYKNVITHKEGVTQTLIDSALAFKNEGFNYYDLIVMTNVLGGTMSSYLWNQFREERSIAYQVGSYLANIDPAHLNVHLYAGLNDEEDADLAKNIFRDAFTYAKAISEEDFNKGINIALASQLSGEETETGILSMVRDALYFGFNVDDYVTTLKNITYDSYQSFVEQVDPANMVTGILYPLK